MSLSSRLLLHRAMRVARRSARQRRRQLERELACYFRPSDRDDLLATLDRYPDGVTNELRAVLVRQQLDAESLRWPAIGRS